MELQGKSFVVTGGAGFIGSHVVDCLLRENPKSILILDTLERGRKENLSEALKDSRVRLEQVDITRPGLESYFDGCDGCFHLAGLRITQCAAEPRKALEVMVNGTFNVAEAAVQAKVKKIVFSSTASVYGLADVFPTPESQHPYNNRTWYGATKVCGEGLLRSFNDVYGLDYVALRYFNVYGPRMDVFGKYTEVFIRWMECFERGEKPKIFGDGQQTMDFIEVTDIARANIAAMRAEVTDAVINVASSTETSLLGLLQGLGRAWGLDRVDPEFMPERKVNPVPRRLADTSRMRAELGLTSLVPLEEGLKRLVEWYHAEKQDSARLDQSGSRG